MKLNVTDLVCHRGGRTVFSRVGFSLAAGNMLVLRGRNGAGKTSLLRMIAGLNEPAAGTLELEGGQADLAIAQQCHFIAHQEAFKPALTVDENLQFWCDFFDGGDIDEALKTFSLEPLMDFAGALLSAGQKRRLALSRLALVHRPIWLLDEPSVGLDTASVEQLQGLMKKHLQDGGMIIATTHVDLGMENAAVFDFNTLEAAA